MLDGASITHAIPIICFKLFYVFSTIAQSWPIWKWYLFQGVIKFLSSIVPFFPFDPNTCLQSNLDNVNFLYRFSMKVLKLKCISQLILKLSSGLRQNFCWLSTAQNVPEHEIGKLFRFSFEFCTLKDYVAWPPVDAYQGWLRFLNVLQLMHCDEYLIRL